MERSYGSKSGQKDSPVTSSTVPAPASPWEGRPERPEERERKRQAILTTAAQLFSVQGYRNTSLDDVARALHVTKPTLYHYFRNKDELLYECAHGALLRLKAAYDGIAQGPGSGLHKLKIFLQLYAQTIETDRGRCFVRIGDHELGYDNRARIRAILAEIDKKLRQLVANAVADGSIAPCDPKITAFALAGMLNSIGHWYQPDSGLSAEDIAERYITLAVKGLEPRT